MITVTSAGGKHYLNFKKSDIALMPKEARTFLGKQMDDAKNYLRRSINNSFVILRTFMYNRTRIKNPEDAVGKLKFTLHDVVSTVEKLTDDQQLFAVSNEIFNVVNEIIRKFEGNSAANDVQDVSRDWAIEQHAKLSELWNKFSSRLKETAFDDAPPAKSQPKSGLIPPDRKIY